MKNGILSIFALGLGAAAGAAASNYLSGKTIKEKTKKVDKFKTYYNMLNQWLLLKQEGKSAVSFFVKKGYKTVAIYGMGEMGNRLYEELKGSGIEVKYGIDKSAANTYSELKVVEPDDEFEEVDVIIVTAIFAFDEIEQELSEKTDIPVISLEDCIYEI